MRLIGDSVLITAVVHDKYYADEIEATGRLFPSWETSVKDGYGNYPGAENSEAFAATVLDFLGT